MSTSEIEERERASELDFLAWAALTSEEDHRRWRNSPEGIRAMEALAKGKEDD